jgi:hypothetical protein
LSDTKKKYSTSKLAFGFAGPQRGANNNEAISNCCRGEGMDNFSSGHGMGQRGYCWMGIFLWACGRCCPLLLFLLLNMGFVEAALVLLLPLLWGIIAMLMLMLI